MIDQQSNSFTNLCDSLLDARLIPIVNAVKNHQRLTLEDGKLLLESSDIWSIGQLAHLIRQRLHGSKTYYNINRHINYSNICALSCRFCAFHRKKGDDGAYEMTHEEILDEASKAVLNGATEIHIVGGLHPWLSFEWYVEIIKKISQKHPNLHIKGFTAVEIVHFTRISKRGRKGDQGIKEVLEILKNAGLGSLPGGGAEIFDDRVHDEAFKGKMRAGTWLKVHQIAHEVGLCSNATMLYGHVEKPIERIKHLIVLREEQDRALIASGLLKKNQQELPAMDGAIKPSVSLKSHNDLKELKMSAKTNGWFQTLIPLPFFPDKSDLEHLPGPSALENLKTLAISRIMLDNVPHIKAFWIMQSLEMAQIMLLNGANDIDGTVVWYDITKVNSASTHQETTVSDLQQTILQAGLTPIERDTLYNPIQRNNKKIIQMNDTPIGSI